MSKPTIQSVNVPLKWLISTLARIDKDIYVVDINGTYEGEHNGEFIGRKDEPLRPGNISNLKYLPVIKISKGMTHTPALVRMAINDILSAAGGYLAADVLVHEVQKILVMEDKIAEVV